MADALWTTIKTHVDAGDVLSTGIDKKDKSVKGEGEGNLGLVTGHAYSLLEAREVKVDSGERLKMVRLRNPWGNDKEWEGAWADGSPLWRANPKLAKRLKQVTSSPTNSPTSSSRGAAWATCGGADARRGALRRPAMKTGPSG